MALINMPTCLQLQVQYGLRFPAIVNWVLQKTLWKGIMGLSVFSPNCVVNFSSCSYISKQPKLGTTTLVLRDTHLRFRSRNDQLTVVTRKADGSGGGGPLKESHGPRRTQWLGEGEKVEALEGKEMESSRKEEIIASLRRIRYSISGSESKSSEMNTPRNESKSSRRITPRNESTSNRRKIPNPSRHKSLAASLLKILRESDEQPKDQATDKIRQRKRVAPQMQDAQNNSQQPSTVFKLIRLPSNFTKRSPIPYPSARRGKVTEPEAQASALATDEREPKVPRVETMKLAELKALAKAKGIRGYSKMKKGELLELLKS